MSNNIKLIGVDIAKENSVDNSCLTSRCTSCMSFVEIINTNELESKATFDKCPRCGIKFSGVRYRV